MERPRSTGGLPTGAMVRWDAHSRPLAPRLWAVTSPTATRGSPSSGLDQSSVSRSQSPRTISPVLASTPAQAGPNWAASPGNVTTPDTRRFTWVTGEPGPGCAAERPAVDAEDLDVHGRGGRPIRLVPSDGHGLVGRKRTIAHGGGSHPEPSSLELGCHLIGDGRREGDNARYVASTHDQGAKADRHDGEPRDRQQVLGFRMAIPIATVERPTP